MVVHALTMVTRPSAVTVILHILELLVRILLAVVLLIPAKMVAHAPIQDSQTTCVIVVSSSLDGIVMLLLITVHYQVPTVTMEAVWMVLVLLHVSVTQDTLETLVMLR